MQDLLGSLSSLSTIAAVVASGASAYVVLAIRALRADVGRKLAELEVRIIKGINGTYVRTTAFEIFSEQISKRIDELREDLRLLP